MKGENNGLSTYLETFYFKDIEESFPLVHIMKSSMKDDNTWFVPIIQRDLEILLPLYVSVIDKYVIVCL